MVSSGSPRPHQSLANHLAESWWEVALDYPLPRRPELRDHLAAICHKHALAGADQAQILAEAILQFPDTDGAHGRIVATCSYIVQVTRAVPLFAA